MIVSTTFVVITGLTDVCYNQAFRAVLIVIFWISFWKLKRFLIVSNNKYTLIIKIALSFTFQFFNVFMLWGIMLHAIPTHAVLFGINMYSWYFEGKPWYTNVVDGGKVGDP